MPPEIIDEVKQNRMAIDRVYRPTKGEYTKPAKAGQETGREEPAPEHERFQVSGEVTQPVEHQAEPDNDRLAKLDLWVHRGNLNIPPGNDTRLEAAKAMLNSLRGFAVPEEFTGDRCCPV